MAGTSPVARSGMRTLRPVRRWSMHWHPCVCILSCSGSPPDPGHRPVRARSSRPPEPAAACGGKIAFPPKLLKGAQPRWVVIENVRNMLVLDQGRAMSYLIAELERLGYRWAYRLVDSRFAGVPQRRQRVLLVASASEDPTRVLFAEDGGEPAVDSRRTDAY